MANNITVSLKKLPRNPGAFRVMLGKEELGQIAPIGDTGEWTSYKYNCGYHNHASQEAAIARFVTL